MCLIYTSPAKCQPLFLYQCVIRIAVVIPRFPRIPRLPPVPSVAYIRKQEQQGTTQVYPSVPKCILGQGTTLVTLRGCHPSIHTSTFGTQVPSTPQSLGQPLSPRLPPSTPQSLGQPPGCPKYSPPRNPGPRYSQDVWLCTCDNLG